MTIFLKAKKGIKIPFPGNPKRYLSEDGENVTYSFYWERRMLEGAAEKIKEKKKSKNDNLPSTGGN